MTKKKDGETNASKFKSPIRKLVTFFKGSRDKWKSKCQDAKYQIKLLKKRLLYMEKRRAELKWKIKTLEKELESSQTQENRLAEEVERLKKNPY